MYVTCFDDLQGMNSGQSFKRQWVGLKSLVWLPIIQIHTVWKSSVHNSPYAEN
jgi:hypothetical protein